MDAQEESESPKRLLESAFNIWALLKCRLPELSWIYLVETPLPPPSADKKVYKFGGCTVADMPQHMLNLFVAFGYDCVLNKSFTVPPDRLSDKLSELKRAIGSTYEHVHGNEEQLVALSNEDLEVVHGHMGDREARERQIAKLKEELARLKQMVAAQQIEALQKEAGAGG